MKLSDYNNLDTHRSYRQIIKSTGIFGGSQVITVLLGIARNKILAILLGASGIGLISIYQNILDLIKSVSSLGLETSGVREIASISETGDEDKIVETVSLIDRWCLIFASVGALLCILLSYPISIWAFESSIYVPQICLLSVCIFFSVLAIGQTVVLHGLRRITYMVKASVSGGVIGLILSIPLYYYFRMDAIIPALIVTNAGVYITAYYYRRKIAIHTIPISAKLALAKSISILKIGFFIVISSLLTTVGYFLIRTFLNKDLGLYSVGLYQAVWSVSGISLALILRSMGADFYPRLCAIIEDYKKTKTLINEQTYIVLVVSVPMIVLLLLLSKLVLSLLYSAEFVEAYSLLNWQVLGTFFKVLSWPLGFILLAKGKGVLYFVSEMLFLLVYLGFTYALYNTFGLESVGIAYLIAYVVYLLVVYILGVRLCSFRWSIENLKIGFISFLLVLLVFAVVQFHREYIIIAGIPLLIISLVYSLIKLNQVFPVKSLMNFFKNK